MNFLELAKKLRQECGVAGVGPASVISQTGQAKQLVDWINDAWLEIQGSQDNWGFMREGFSFNTVANLGDYTPDGAAGVGAALTEMRYWHRDTLRAYRTTDGVVDEQWLVEWDYGVFRDTYRFGLQVTGRPVVFAVKPKDDALMFGSIPDQVYTIRGEYQRNPTVLTLNEDIPDIPKHLHMVIVYKAMEYYGLYEAAGEQLSRAQIGYARLMAQLEREQLPTITISGSLA